MNKKAIIFTVAILILLVGASVIYFTMDRSSEAETENSSSMKRVGTRKLEFSIRNVKRSTDRK